MSEELITKGAEMHRLASQLYPICRSLTGNGVRQTLAILQQQGLDISVHEVASGTPAFDWYIPEEWNVDEAYIEDSKGNRIVDFTTHNLHLLGYSEPVNRTISLAELQPHLYSLPEQPDAIPYVTSYYHRRWGFCLTHRQRETLDEGQYRVMIKSQLKPGSMTYGELIIPGESPDEILISTYVCHPSMANNELSGPVVTTFLAKWLNQLPSRRYTYRIVFLPETIGSIYYISQHLASLKKNVKAGFVVTCIGDERTYSYLPSRQENTLADRVAKHVLKHLDSEVDYYSYLDRGSDERQYCSPGVDLPVCSVMRSKYGTYPEYHTSLDDLNLVTPDGLLGGFNVLKSCLLLLEHNTRYQARVCCEPQLGRRGLYPTISSKDSANHVQDMMNLLAYADGSLDLIGIGDKINAYAGNLLPIVEKLVYEGLLLKESS